MVVKFNKKNHPLLSHHIAQGIASKKGKVKKRE